MVYKKVDFINSSYRRFYSSHKKEIDSAIQRCLSKGQLTLREEVWNLERNIAKYVGTKYAASVGSGTDALFLSLLALGIKKGDEVITVSNTFIATIQAIVHTGATPILIDVTENEQMDVTQLKKAITNKTKAIIPVHYTGATADMYRIYETLFETKHINDIFVVEDACQALGAKIADEFDGSLGTVGCFSFNTAKMLGGLSDGGIVVTNDRNIYERVCLLRNHWNVHQLSVDRNDYPQPKTMQWAWKSRLSNINAAFLNVKFKEFDKMLDRRKEIAEKYINELSYIQAIHLPENTPGRVWQEFHLQTENRDELVNFLKQRGVETLVRDSVPNHKMKGLNLSHFKLPVTERLAKRVVRIPLYPEMTNQEVNYVIQCVKKFYDAK